MGSMSIPRHIGIIMDGNGRWAEKRGLPKILGHREGVKTVERVTEACAKKGVKAVTLYAFSSENWKRPKKEINALMELFRENLKSKSESLLKNNVRFNAIGRLSELSQSLQNELSRVIQLTSQNTGIIMTLAINYGSRQEILDAFTSFSEQKGDGLLTEDEFEKHLYTNGLPALDFVIRTSGELRLSNFLLWQAAYAEIYVTDALWPDFSDDELEKALNDFAQRNRRYGG